VPSVARRGAGWDMAPQPPPSVKAQPGTERKAIIHTRAVKWQNMGVRVSPRPGGSRRNGLDARDSLKSHQQRQKMVC